MSEWIEWDVDDARAYQYRVPLILDEKVLVKFRDGSNDLGKARDFNWDNDAHRDCQIIAYKILSGTHTQISDKSVSVDDMVDSIRTVLVKEKAVDVANTNPKRQYGLKSIPVNLWPPLATAYGSIGLYNGSLKYSQGNYKATPVEASIYIAAGMRHFMAWADGEEFDPKDKVPNLAGVLANVAILLEARANGTLIDDRQISSGYLQEREALEKIVASLQELHKDKNPKHNWAKDQ